MFPVLPFSFFSLSLSSNPPSFSNAVTARRRARVNKPRDKGNTYIYIHVERNWKAERRDNARYALFHASLPLCSSRLRFLRMQHAEAARFVWPRDGLISFAYLLFRAITQWHNLTDRDFSPLLREWVIVWSNSEWILLREMWIEWTHRSNFHCSCIEGVEELRWIKIWIQ